MAKDFSKLDKIIGQFDLDKDATNLFTWYDVLDIELYGSYDKKKDMALEDYIMRELATDKKKLEVGKALIRGVKTLQDPLKEKAYKEKLEKSYKVKLEKLVETLSEGDTITEANRKKVLKQAKQYKLGNDIIDETLKKLRIIPDHGGGGGTITPEGTPIIEIINSETNEKLQEIVLTDVKLSSKVTQTIIIKNGGGGYLNATVKSTAPWIQLSSTKIEQKDLPKSINVIINPSRDKTLQNSAIYEGKLVFTYTTLNGKAQPPLPLPIQIFTEGAEKAARKKSLGAVLIYFAVYFGANTYLPSATSALSNTFLSLSWWIVAFFLWVTATWFFRKQPQNKLMVVLLPAIFIACMYFATKSIFKPKDADLIIIPINEMAYVKTANGAIIRDFPIEGGSLDSINYGDSVMVLGRDSTSNWYKVSYYNGGTTFGYMSKELLTFDKSEVRTRKKKVINGSRANRAMNKSRKSKGDSTINVVDEGLVKPDSI